MKRKRALLASSRALMRMRYQPSIRVALPYFADPVYIEVVTRIKELASKQHVKPLKPPPPAVGFSGVPDAPDALGFGIHVAF